MNTLRRFDVVLSTLGVILSSLFVILSLSKGAIAKDEPAAARGRALFTSVGCYECHGYAGQGGNAGPRIAAIDWNYQRFSAFVRHPGREMPPYTDKVLSDAEVSAIYAYVKSLPAPRSAPR